MQQHKNVNPAFLVAFCLLVLLSAPIWVPLAMCACIATGKSLNDYNNEANKL